MKKFKLMALALAIGTSSLFAFNTNPNTTTTSDIKTNIVELLKAPNFTVEQEISINLKFTFSSEGEIVVLKVDSKDNDILNYIRQNINYKKIDNAGERGKIYTMRLKLKVV